MDIQDRAVILAVTVNGMPGDLGAIFLQDEAGRLFAPRSFLDAWNIKAHDARIKAADGSVQFDLSKIAGLTYSWNHETAELAITAAPEAFLGTAIDIGSERARRVAPYTPGGYLNYDLSTTHAPGLNSNVALLDVALFRGTGLLTGSFVAGSAGHARLMTTWQTDRIDAIKTLRIGDSYNSTGAWGRGVLFGGIQYGTHFAIRPDYVTLAMPSVTGKALLPSTVDVYVNHALRSRQAVNAGPFSIQNLPVITGRGEVQVIVKDVLGREQLITQSFFASPNLLRKGLVEDSYELGWLRENYGLTSNDYSDPFASATWRKGFSNRVTGEARVELQRDLSVAGVSAAMQLPGTSSVVESSFVFSRAGELPAGRMASINYSYLGARWSANARLQLNSAGFRQLGSDPANLPQQIGAVQVSTPLAGGTLSVNYLRHLNRGESMTRLLNLNYSRRLAEGVFANLSLLKPLSGGADMVATLGLTILFDRQHVGSSTLSAHRGSATLYTDFQKSAPPNEGTGYRVASMNGSGVRQEASLTSNQSFGSFQADLVRVKDEVSSRFTVRGGIATLGGGLYFARGLDEGFAVVQATGIPGLPVYLENQIVGHTDRRGRALVTNLQAYQDNHIRIDPVTLPLEATIGDVEETVVPRSRGGVLVDFEVLRVRSATLTIVQADGTLLPPWTAVEVVGMKQPFVSGNRGEVFVDLPQPRGNRVIARPEGGPACELRVDQPDAGMAAPFLEPLRCTAIQ